MKKTTVFAGLFLFSPSKAAAACVEDAALLSGLKVYGLTLLATAAFFRLKPYDFPDANAAAAMGPQGMFFWLKVMLWQPLLMAALIGFCGGLLRWMKDGWLPLKVATSFFWTAVPFILTLLYRNNALPKAAFACLLIAWVLPGVYVAAGVTGREWRVLATFLLGLNAVELAAMIPETAVTIMRWEAGYQWVGVLAGLWMLLTGALGLKALPPGRGSAPERPPQGPRPLPRALLPLLFALVLQIVVVFAAYTLGWLPVETLKALIYG